MEKLTKEYLQEEIEDLKELVRIEKMKKVVEKNNNLLYEFLCFLLLIFFLR